MPATVAVIVEWENALLSDVDRAEQMLHKLGEQAQAYARSHNTRFELLVMYNSADIEEAVPRTTVSRQIDPRTWPGEIRYIEAPNLHYYDQKNLGVASTKADVTLFLDSDVVPDEGWLGALLDAIDKPEVMVVGGQTYLARDTYLDKLFAGFWFFKPNPKKPGLQPDKSFFANNVAFKREFFEKYRFGHADSYRGQCVQMARKMRADGVTIWRNGDAAVSHPAPDGLSHAFVRAVCHGYDAVYWRRRRPGGWFWASPIAAFGRFLRAIWRTIFRVPKRAVALRIDPITALVSFVFGIGFSTVIFFSEVIAYFFPSLIRKNIQI